MMDSILPPATKPFHRQSNHTADPRDTRCVLVANLIVKNGTIINFDTCIELVAYPGHVFHGVVQGVGWGITQQDVVVSDSLPTVAPTVNWVRLAQRFPVRVDIIDPDPAFPLRMGQTAVVSIDTSNYARRGHDIRGIPLCKATD